jgi:hypothetical protein
MAAERYNLADADDLDALIDSPGWALVKERIELQLDRERSELERDLPERDTARIRGAIRQLLIVHKLPELMRDEIRQQRKP